MDDESMENLFDGDGNLDQKNKELNDFYNDIKEKKVE